MEEDSVLRKDNDDTLFDVVELRFVFLITKIWHLSIYMILHYSIIVIPCGIGHLPLLSPPS